MNDVPNLSKRIELYKDTNRIKEERWGYELSYSNTTTFVLHTNDDTPSLIKYDENGNIFLKEWGKHGIKHRDNGPATIYYHNNGNIKKEMWHQHGNEEVRKDGSPNIIIYYESGKPHYHIWRVDNLPHRVGNPSEISYDENGDIIGEKWGIQSMYHRDDGPAFINYLTGETEYYINDVKISSQVRDWEKMMGLDGVEGVKKWNDECHLLYKLIYGALI